MRTDSQLICTDGSALAELADSIVTQAQEKQQITVVAIDGRSGAGKSTLAKQLVNLLGAISTQSQQRTVLFHLENMYQGWEGLLEATEDWSSLVQQLRKSNCGHWTGWNWETSRAVPHQQLCLPETQDGEPVVLVGEGVGAFCADADFTCWVERPTSTRKTAALQRDGETYRPFWDTWALQEEKLFEQRAERYRRADCEILVPDHAALTG